MSKKGGYKIVSLGGIDLLGEDLSLKGLYDALKVSHGKPILLTDINIDGEHKKDALVQANEGANKINIKNLYGYDLEVAKSGDVITVSPSPDGIELPVPTAEDDGKIVGVNVQGKYVLKPLANLPFVNKMDAPSSTTLTEEQANKIKEGAFINGVFLGLKNPVFFPLTPYTHGIYIGSQSTGSTESVIGRYSINSENVIRLDEGAKISLDSDLGVIITGLKKVNDKTIPQYPSSTGTFTLKCVDGVLTWVQDV